MGSEARMKRLGLDHLPPDQQRTELLRMAAEVEKRQRERKPYPHGRVMKSEIDEPEKNSADVPPAPSKKPVKYMGLLDGSCELPEFEPGELVTMRVGDLPPVTFRAIGKRK